MDIVIELIDGCVGAVITDQPATVHLVDYGALYESTLADAWEWAPSEFAGVGADPVSVRRALEGADNAHAQRVKALKNA